MTRLLKTPIIGRSVAIVDSSRIDMLAGLANQPTLRIPPAFWAKAPSTANNTRDSEAAAMSTRRSRLIPIGLLFRGAGLENPLLHPSWPVYWALVQSCSVRSLPHFKQRHIANLAGNSLRQVARIRCGGHGAVYALRLHEARMIKSDPNTI